MGQVARPASDDSIVGWSPSTNLFARINGVAPNTATPAVSVSNPHGAGARVKLSGIAWPENNEAVLTVGLQGDGATPALVVLSQGGLVIAAKRVVPPASWQNVTITLPAEQIAPVSNYADLHVAVIAGDVVVAGCTIPTLLYLTFSNGSDGCECLNELSYPLIWSPSLGLWENTGNPVGCSGQPFTLMQFNYAAPTWVLLLAGCIFSNTGETLFNCGPFSVSHSGSFVTGACCNGLLTWTVSQ